MIHFGFKEGQTLSTAVKCTSISRLLPKHLLHDVTLRAL